MRKNRRWHKSIFMARRMYKIFFFGKNAFNYIERSYQEDEESVFVYRAPAAPIDNPPRNTPYKFPYFQVTNWVEDLKPAYSVCKNCQDESFPDNYMHYFYTDNKEPKWTCSDHVDVTRQWMCITNPKWMLHLTCELKEECELD